MLNSPLIPWILMDNIPVSLAQTGVQSTEKDGVNVHNACPPNMSAGVSTADVYTNGEQESSPKLTALEITKEGRELWMSDQQIDLCVQIYACLKAS